MKTKIIFTLLILAVTACGPAAIMTPTVAVSSTPTLFALPTFPPPGSFPTATIHPTPLVNPQMYADVLTQVAVATPVRMPISWKPIIVLPTTFEKDGNIYFENPSGRITQLTSSWIDRDPRLSDDGQRVVFYRGETNDNLHFIDSNGSNEVSIKTSESALLRDKGDITSPVFIPGTHYLVFNTYLCGPRIGLYHGPECTASVFSVDTDTGKIEIIVEDLTASPWKYRNFEISPNGKYVSVSGSGRVDIYSLKSDIVKIIYPNVIAYHITTPDEYLPKQYWLPDSSGLILILAADGQYNDPADPPSEYTALRYTLGDKQGAKIPIDKFIIRGDGWSISPDRNWLLFTGNTNGYHGGGEHFHYLANLTDGHTVAYETWGWSLEFCKWSPDSRHFAFSNTTPWYVGSVDGGMPILYDGFFLEWLDATHFYYRVGTSTDTFKTYVGQIR